MFIYVLTKWLRRHVEHLPSLEWTLFTKVGCDVTAIQDICGIYLEWYVHFWLPYCKKGVIKLEKMQRRFTRMLAGLGG